MRLSDLIEGLKTLQPYYNDGDGYHISTEHDELYASKTDRPMTHEDAQKMRDLYWFQPGKEDDAEYDPESGWLAFT